MDVDQNYSLIEQISTRRKDVDTDCIEEMLLKIQVIGTKFDSIALDVDFMRAVSSAVERLRKIRVYVDAENVKARYSSIEYPTMQDNPTLTNNPGV